MLSELWTDIRYRLRTVVRRDDVAADMDDELRFHLEREADKYVAQGMAPAEARRRAAIVFGGVSRTRDETFEAHGTALFDQLAQDLRYAMRGLRRNPVFALIAVLSLGFGIGAATSVFSVVDALDFRPLPYRDPSALVWLTEVTPRDNEVCSQCPFLTSAATARAWARTDDAFGPLAAAARGGLDWQHDDVSESLNAEAVTPGFFAMLGTRPLIGREFALADTVTGAPPTAVVSYEFWQDRLGGDRNVIGTQLDGAAGQHVTVIGVLPPAFRFRANAPIWLPLAINSTSHAYRSLIVIARVRPGQSFATVNAQLAAVTSRIAAQDPAAFRGWQTAALPLRDLLTMQVGKSRFILFAVTLLVLLIALLNVTALLLARAQARRQEWALRTALGASAGAVARQLVVEGLWVGLAGGAIGLLIAAWASRLMPRWFAVDATGIAITVDFRVVAFGALVAAFVGIAASILPALRVAETDATNGLRQSGATATGQWSATSHALIAVQVALAVTVLSGASLLSHDFVQLRYADIGYRPESLYSTYIIGSREQMKAPAAWIGVAERARARVAAIPGVRSVSLEHINAMHPKIVRPEGQAVAPDSSQTPVVKTVDPNYFTTFETPLVAGRDFAPRDDRSAPLVAVINRGAAKAFWPGVDPIGRRIFLGDSGTAGEIVTVIGVVADAERGELIRRHWPMIYRPMSQGTIYHAAAAIYIRVARNDAAVLTEAQSAIRDETGRASEPLESDLETVDNGLIGRRMNAIALDLFGAFGLLLAAMGIYGSVAYGASRRAREIGIRIALGAPRGTVVRLVARRTVSVVAFGLAAGIGASMLLMRSYKTLTLASDHTMPWVALSSVLLVAVSLVAALVPATRATNVDTVAALRQE